MNFDKQYLFLIDQFQKMLYWIEKLVLISYLNLFFVSLYICINPLFFYLTNATVIKYLILQKYQLKVHS